MAQHRVEIEKVDSNSWAPEWRVGCTCGVEMGGFGGAGMAQNAIEQHHKTRGWTIKKIKVKGK